MIIRNLIKDAMKEFEQKMMAFDQQCDTRQLTAALAHQFCQVLRGALSQAGQKAFQHFIQSYDVKEPVWEDHGQRLRWKQYSVKEFLTPYGLVPIQRSLYQADTGGPSCIPLDHFWDMQNEFATPEVREAVLFAMAHLTGQESEQFFAKCGWFKPSATAIKHMVAQVGEAIEASRDDLYHAIHQQEAVPPETVSVAASMDGVNVLLNEPGVGRGRPAERPGQGVAGEKTCYKNAMVGSFTFYGTVPKGHKTPERFASHYIARMPEERAVTFKVQFEQEIGALESRLDASVTKILLFDGQRSLWNYVNEEGRYDAYEKLVDFYHTTEHLSKAAELLFGKGSAQAQRWYDKYYTKLLEVDEAPTSILHSIHYYQKRKRWGRQNAQALHQEISYFSRNGWLMTYADFRRRGLPISSGPVEAACKSIVKTRLCRSGMRWSRPGGQHILHLRALVKSGRWDVFWKYYRKLKKTA